jgi:hypothetical protein
MPEQKIGVYSPETAKMVLDVIRHLESTGYVVRRSEKTPINDGTHRIHVAKITEEITARDGNTVGQGKAELRQLYGEVGDADTLEEYPSVDPVILDVFSMKTGTQSVGNFVYLVREYATGKWFAIPINDRKTRIRGTVSGGSLFTEATAADPHTLGSIEGIDEIWTGDATIEFDNPEGIKLWSGCTARCEWNATTERYEVYTATANKVVHGIQRLPDECKFEKLDGAAGWNNWDAGTTYSWVTTVYQEGCTLKYDTDCSEDQTIIELSQFVTGIFMSGDCLKYWVCGGSLAGIATGLCFGECEDPPPCDGQYVIYECQLNSGVYSWEPISGPGCTSPCVDGPTITEPANAANLGRQIRVNCVS